MGVRRTPTRIDLTRYINNKREHICWGIPGLWKVDGKFWRLNKGWNPCEIKMKTKWKSSIYSNRPCIPFLSQNFVSKPPRKFYVWYFIFSKNLEAKLSVWNTIRLCPPRHRDLRVAVSKLTFGCNERCFYSLCLWWEAQVLRVFRKSRFLVLLSLLGKKISPWLCGLSLCPARNYMR